MTKFTTSDFLASARSTASTANAAKRPAPIIVDTELPSLPSLVHSPGFEPPADTEPFPGFRTVLDLDPVEKAEPLHCMIHCRHDICKKLIHYKFRRIQLPCWCMYEQQKKQDEPEACAPVVPLQELDIAAYQSLRQICAHAFTNRSQELEVRLPDMLTLLHQLEAHMTPLALQDPILTEAVERYFGEDDHITIDVVCCQIFKELRTYFTRSLGVSGTGTITPRQLYAELGVYLWTLVGKVFRMKYDEAAAIRLCGGDPRVLARQDYDGPFHTVLSYWWECLDQTVAVVVWRNLQIQLAKEQEAAKKAKKAAEWFSMDRLASSFSSLLG